MKMVKTLLIGSLLISSIGSAKNRQAMVDGISDDMIAKVNGVEQIVNIAGPKDMDETKAVILKSDDGETGKLYIIGTKGIKNYYLAAAEALTLELEDKSMAGRESSIRVNKQGSLVLNIQNSSVGRGRFSSDITIAYRNGEFVVAGFTNQNYDTVTNEGGSCDLNLLTGKGVKDGKAIKVNAKILAESLNDDDARLYSCQDWE